MDSSPGDGEVHVPKYYDVKVRLRRRIERLPAGTALAAERTLAEEFRSSRTTIRQALAELALEGLVIRLQGRGTFVAPPKVTQSLQLTSYTQDMEQQGFQPSSRLLGTRVEAAGEELAARLEVAGGTEVLRIDRLRLADHVPMALENVHVDASRFPGLADLLDAHASLYTILRDRFGVQLADGWETVETVLASPAEAALLQVDTGSPMLLLNRTTRDGEGQVIEFVRSVYRGDRYRFTTRLEPPP